MDFVVYGNKEQLCGDVLSAFAAGCEARDHLVSFVPPTKFRDHPLGDVGVVWGMRPPSPEIVTAYLDRARVVLVLDSGHIKREDGYFQCSLNRLNWLPPFECPPDRAQMMGLTPAARNRRKDYVLVCGQKPRDAQHGLGRAALEQWAMSAFLGIRNGNPDIPIRWRPHPEGLQVVPSGADQVSDPREVPLEDDLSGAMCMVTINSGAGCQALLQGVPVFATGPAVYSEVACNGTFKKTKPPLPARGKFFARLAYAQWTKDEMAQGLPLQFLAENIKEF